MPDIIDIAQDHADEMLALQIAAARPKSAVVSCTFCESCDAPIPEARRRAVQGVELCVSCQEIKERRSAHIKGGAQ
ncbi:TraR/DksA family transcriptional regulator [Pantoea dispersa]|uniref:TraR/DksA family transcriptional regulator n=1 Tax=Pantoea dispersa TaxID=59814 RepID=UPI0039BDB60E